MKRDFERVTVADGVRDSLLSVILPESAVMRELSKLVDSPRVKVISWKVTVGAGFGEEDVTKKMVVTSAMVESNLLSGEGRLSSDSIFGPIVSDCVIGVVFVSGACLLSPLLLTRCVSVPQRSSDMEALPIRIHRNPPRLFQLQRRVLCWWSHLVGRDRNTD